MSTVIAAPAAEPANPAAFPGSVACIRCDQPSWIGLCRRCEQEMERDARRDSAAATAAADRGALGELGE
jgi:hypothetical protein